MWGSRTVAGRVGLLGLLGVPHLSPRYSYPPIVFGLPELVVPENPADFDRLEVTFCGVCKQSGTATATATASVQYII